VALLLAGGPIAGLLLYGRVEVLAEVASLLHLVMYALMCVTLLVLRVYDPDWYEPDFTCPAGMVVAGLGAVASVGLIAFMNPLSIVIGGGILVAAGGWYYVYAHSVSLSALDS
jgi:amino acid transporter